MLSKPHSKIRFSKLLESISRSPARISLCSYAVIIFCGAFLLMLPYASTRDQINFIDALFTATSATCVTGLAVLDTGTDFTIFGQTVLLILIQIGGVGIMAISTFFLLMAGKKVSLSGQFALKGIYSFTEQPRILPILKNIVLFTVAIETVGMIFIFYRFYADKTIHHPLFSSAFHSISAFCNAGFSLFPGSLTTFHDDFLINIVICILIISGGLGFVVLSELKQWLRWKRRTGMQFTLHTKLVLFTTLLILFVSTLAIFIMEWDNTLSDVKLTNRLLASFFQSVTARTAGFNTIPIANMANETLFFLMLLMFIGAAPGSCGGGIKITTFASMIILGISKLRGSGQAHIFKRKISDKSMMRGTSLIMISIIFLAASIMLIQMTELGNVPHSASRGKFLELSFEVFSAFGTVGLSTGVTNTLSNIGKLIIILVMFVGRLGPLVIAFAMSSRKKTIRYTYAEEDIMIG